MLVLVGWAPPLTPGPFDPPYPLPTSRHPPSPHQPHPTKLPSPHLYPTPHPNPTHPLQCRGLDQSVALPRDSYLQRYYADVMASLRVGPPAMLVVQRLNVSEAAPDVDAVCSVAGCDQDSLLNQVWVKVAGGGRRAGLWVDACGWVRARVCRGGEGG